MSTLFYYKKGKLPSNSRLYNLSNDWNLELIKNRILKSKKEQSLPSFALDRVEIQPTSVCQNRCPFCYGAHLRPAKQSELPIEVIEKNILQDLRKSKKFVDQDPLIVLAGLYNEPLCYSQIGQLIRLLGHYKSRFGLYTNGTFLNKELCNSIIRSALSAKSSKQSYISFNITASFVNGEFNDLVQKLKNFIQLRNEAKAPLDIYAPILVIDSLKEKELETAQQTLLRIGIDSVRYFLPQEPVNPRNPLPYSRMVELTKNLKNKGGNRVYLRSLSTKPFDHCFVMSTSVSIDAKGNVYPCSQSCAPYYLEKLCYGSLKNKELSKLWGSREHKRLFKKCDPQTINCRCNPMDEQFNRICTCFY